MAAADRDLLFGLLALNNGLIDQNQLADGVRAWTTERAQTLADHLVALGHVTQTQRPAVEAFATIHLEAHDGRTERSLAAIAAGPSTRAMLATVGDPEIDQTLAHVGSGSEGDSDRNASFAVGTATSNGQRFRVLRPHARGGLGAVHVALDQELHREVALKQILDEHADDPVSRARFLLEAEVTGGLEHPGIVPVYGLGTDTDGRPYYAMRFIKGDSLKEAADAFHSRAGAAQGGRDGVEKNPDAARPADPGQRSLEFRKLLLRFFDVCNAIEYAHSRGVLHRDIKPGNIIVGKHGETLVVDWGLAKATGRVEPGADLGEQTLVPSSASGSAETLPGRALGTPSFMSPEQAEGDLENLGPRSDVYSLGATLYYLLTGRPPVAGDSRRRAPRRQAGPIPAAATARRDDRPGAGGGLLEGDGARPGGALRLAQGAGRGRRALDGRRAGLGLARAAVAAGTALGEAEPDGGRHGGGGAAGRGGGPVGGAGRADPGQDRDRPGAGPRDGRQQGPGRRQREAEPLPGRCAGAVRAGRRWRSRRFTPASARTSCSRRKSSRSCATGS